MIGDYNFDLIGKYLDQDPVRKALYVDPRVKAWKDTSKRIAYLLKLGEQNAVACLFPRLFEEIPVLIYKDMYNMDFNFIGTDKWIKNQARSYREEFISKKNTPWMVDNQVAGYYRSVKNLTQVLVKRGGASCAYGPTEKCSCTFE